MPTLIVPAFLAVSRVSPLLVLLHAANTAGPAIATAPAAALRRRKSRRVHPPAMTTPPLLLDRELVIVVGN